MKITDLNNYIMSKLNKPEIEDEILLIKKKYSKVDFTEEINTFDKNVEFNLNSYKFKFNYLDNGNYTLKVFDADNNILVDKSVIKK